MNDFRTRQTVLIILLTICAAVGWSYLTTIANSESENLVDEIPLTLEGWIGKDIFIKNEIFTILETRDIIVREYQNNGLTVTLAIVYHANNESTFHPPESCLGGIGYTILDEGNKNVQLDTQDNLIEVRSVQYHRNNTREQIYYFYQTGDIVTPNYLTFRWQMLLNQLKHKRTSGALIRVSTPIQPNSSPEETLHDFLTKVFPTLNNFMRIDAAYSQKKAWPHK